MARKMLFRYCFLALLIRIVFGVDENCTSDNILTEIDNDNTDMPSEDQHCVIDAVKNATLEGGDEEDIVEHIHDILDPSYDQKKEWTVIQLPTASSSWYDAKMYITVCWCKNCTEYFVSYVTHDEVEE